MLRAVSKSTLAALVAAGAGAIALVIWHRRRAARRAADFEARIRALGANPSVYDVAPHNILNFSQGSFALVEADLSVAFDASAAAEAAAALRAAGIERAIALRRELVNVKKACLASFHDAAAVEATLRRCELFFFQDRERVPGTIEPPDSSHRYTTYARVSEALQTAVGLRFSVHDARDITKALCCLPRHPEMEAALPAALRGLAGADGAANAVGGATVATALAHAEEFVRYQCQRSFSVDLNSSEELQFLHRV